MKTFNPAILFFCLLGERESFTWNDTQSGRPHHDFVQLYERDYGEIGDVTRRFPRFLGVRRTRNAPITFNDNVKNNCNTFLDEHSASFQENHFNYVIFALKSSTDPQISSESISKIIEYHNSNQKEWFYETYKIAYSTNCLDPDASLENCITIYRQLLRAYESQIFELEHRADNAEDNAPRDIKKEARIVAKEWFENKKTTGRYRGYFSSTGETEITEIHNKLLTEKGDELSLYDILFYLNSQNDHSVNLCGIGGSGKTHQIFNCISKIFSSKTSVIPFYVPLNSVRNTSSNSIISYLSSYINLGNIEEVKTILKEGGASILLACDGFNEITSDELRKIIANDICQIRQDYKTRFIISSRRDHTALFNSLNYGEDQVFKKAEVMPLNEKQIDRYFKKVNCVARYKYVATATRRLLQTPQGCVMYADLVGSDRKKISYFTSLGELLHDYIRRILPIGSDVTRIDEYLKKVAYYMVQKGKFHIYQRELQELIGLEPLLWLIENNRVETVFAKENDCFTFCHQHFRDYYCGLAFSEMIKDITADNISQSFNKLFDVNNYNITTNDEILELTSAFINDDDRSIQSKIDILRENKDKLQAPFFDNYDFPLKVLIRIYAFAHDNNIAKLNLMLLNLKEVNLSGYKLYDSEHRSVILANADISLNTFLKPGLMGAASTICKYQLNDKLYIAAFALTTAIIIDVNENQFEVVRNLPNWGWVNVAYPKLYNGRLAIFLGHRNGNVGIFYPDMIKTPTKDLYIMTRDGKLVPKGNGEIESIEIVKWNGTEYIVFCNSTGEVFYRELNSDNTNNFKTVSLCNDKFPLNNVKNAFVKRGWDITCHLTYRKDNNTIIIAFGNKLFCLDGNNESVKLTALEVRWNGMNPSLILDVCASSNYLFVNEGDVISILKFSPTGVEKIRELIVDYEGSLNEYINRRAKRLADTGKYTHEKIERIKSNEKACSLPIEVKRKEFRFKYFTLAPSDYYPNEDVVLIGLEADKGYEDAYDVLPRFYEIHVSSNERDKVSIKVLNNEQKLASHSGVYYKQNATVFVATTADDRSVDLFPTNNEEMVNTHIEGAYYGVRDLKFIDNNTILCALYDGSVLLISKSSYDVDKDDLQVDDEFEYNTSEEMDNSINELPNAVEESADCSEEYSSYNEPTTNWGVSGVIKTHDDWVWKALPLQWENQKHKYVLSCSYDKTIKKVDFMHESLRPEVIIHGVERILEFYISNEHHSTPVYWGLSEHYIYNTSSRSGKEGYQAENGVVYRCFVESEQAEKTDNVPIVFYSDKDGGHIGKFTSNSQMIKLIDFKEKSVFIRKLAYYKSKSGIKYLIAAGVNNQNSYIAIFTHKSEDEYIIITDLSITQEKTTGANAFTVFENDDVLYILIANKNNTLSLCTFCDDNLLFRNNISVDAQPLCLDSRENKIFVGLLDGSIIELSIDFKKNILIEKPILTIKTHANLYSTPDVNLKKCQFDDDKSLIDVFKRDLSSYFTL